MRAANARTAGVLLGAALVLAACTGTDDIEPPDAASPTPASPTPAITDTQQAESQDPPALDDVTAAELYIAWRETVYALAPTPPEAVDVEAASDGIVVPDSEASAWVAQELQLARDRGVVVRGGVNAEPISAIQIAGDRATVTICSSADVGVTDVATGDRVSDEAIDTSYTRFDVGYRRMGEGWLIERADRSNEGACVPPSIEQALSARWEQFAEAWYERDRQGGGEELGGLAEVVTDRFADTLRGLPPRDPVPDPAPFTDFGTIAATRTTATGRACRSGGLETIEWMLVDEQWRVDFAGQIGQDATPCP